MINTLLDNYIIEPFNNLSNNKNISNNSLIQISLFLLVISIYFYLYSSYDKTGILFIFAYILFKTYIHSIEDNDDKITYEMLFFIISTVLLVLNAYNKKFSTGTNILIGLFILISFISYCLKNNDMETEDPRLQYWQKIVKYVNDFIYPKEHIKIKKYHYDKFWNFFDFNSIVILTFILIINS